ncbi:hypothetical protein KUTG_08083 [Kutzneria sp. 744]|nr:hypothetical protein KUTG_08083 [Kutzneria sp. 744]
MALEAWYDPDDDDPIRITSAADADALLDRMAADGAGFAVPPLAELSRHDDEWAVAYVGVNVATGRGIMTHSDATGSAMTIGGDAAGAVAYDYMGNVRELPGSAEIPLADLRRAATGSAMTIGGDAAGAVKERKKWGTSPHLTRQRRDTSGRSPAGGRKSSSQTHKCPADVGRLAAAEQ